MIFRKLTCDTAKKRLNQLDLIQSKFDIQFPLLYLNFIKTYAVGQYTERWESSLDKFIRLNSVIEVFFDNDEINLPYGWLFSPEELHYDLKNYSEKDLLLNQHGVIRIGNIVSGGGLYLGIKEDNTDNIFKMIWDHDSCPIKIADSIFDFINCLHINFNHPGLSKRVGQLFLTDPQVSFKFNDTVKVKILVSSKEKLSTINELEFLSKLNQLFSDVRDRNFGIST